MGIARKFSVIRVENLDMRSTYLRLQLKMGVCINFYTKQITNDDFLQLLESWDIIRKITHQLKNLWITFQWQLSNALCQPVYMHSVWIFNSAGAITTLLPVWCKCACGIFAHICSYRGEIGRWSKDYWGCNHTTSTSIRLSTLCMIDWWPMWS